MNRIFINIILMSAVIFGQSKHLLALTFELPENSNIVGRLQTAIVQPGESLGDIGKRFDLGVYEMIEANPGVDPWTPSPGVEIIIPTQFVLPDTRQDGLVINLAEMRLYYYHHKQSLVTTHPIGIGRKGWVTPLGETKIVKKQANPSWYPPASIIKEHAARGDILPSVVPAGPRNPLGAYAIYLALPGYLIHGTNRPGGIGLRTTSGCIRLFPEDIKSLFAQIPIGTLVKIIHEPYKVGFNANNFYLEAHEPLSDKYYNKLAPAEVLAKAVLNFSARVNKPGVEYFAAKADQVLGYPILVE